MSGSPFRRIAYARAKSAFSKAFRKIDTTHLFILALRSGATYSLGMNNATQTTLPASVIVMIEEYASWKQLSAGYVRRVAQVADSPYFRAMFRCEVARRGMDVSDLVAADDLQDRS